MEVFKWSSCQRSEDWRLEQGGQLQLLLFLATKLMSVLCSKPPTITTGLPGISQWFLLRLISRPLAQQTWANRAAVLVTGILFYWHVQCCISKKMLASAKRKYLYFRTRSRSNRLLFRTKLWARSIQPKFPEISVQNSMDRFGPTGKVSKKLVHLLRWSSFPGRAGLNFGYRSRPVWVRASGPWPAWQEFEKGTVRKVFIYLFHRCHPLSSGRTIEMS